MTASLPPSAPTPVSPTPNERLQRLVPEAVGAWSRASLRGARPGPDGQVHPAAEAEFRKQDLRAWLTVGESALRTPPPSAPTERTTGDGTEKFYAEGDAAVRETVRRVDGRVDVALMRADGVVVSVWGVKIPAAELKALALAVQPLPPR